MIPLGILADGLRPPWTPLAATGLVGWWDAADTSTIAHVDGAVTQWADKSGGGWHMAPTVDTERPITGTRTINGLNVLDHSTAQRLVSTYGFNRTLPAHTLIGVVHADHPRAKYTIGTSWEASVFFGCSSGAYPGPVTARMNNYQFTPVAGVNGVPLDPQTDTAAYAALSEGPKVIHSVGRPTDNGVMIATSPSQNASRFDGGVGELIFGIGMPEADMHACINYLMRKWGI